MSSRPISMMPIGWVRNGWEHPPTAGWRQVVSELQIRAALAPHLRGLEEFSHAYVLFWMHRGTGLLQSRAQVHPRGRADLPQVGVFATHSPYRPNPVGLTIVELVHFAPPSLWVRGLDALDGSPVLDLKSYVPARNERPEARYPAWVRALWELPEAGGEPTNRGGMNGERG